VHSLNVSVLCFVFGLMMAQWAETCRRFFNFWLPIYFVFIDWINYYSIRSRMRVLMFPVSVSTFTHASHLQNIGLWWQPVGGVLTVVTIAWPNNVDWIAPDEVRRTGNLDRRSKESEGPDEWRLDKWDLMEARNSNTL